MDEKSAGSNVVARRGREGNEGGSSRLNKSQCGADAIYTESAPVSQDSACRRERENVKVQMPHTQ